MFYLITQFVVVFLVAALLGGAIGWLMRARTLAKDLEAKWKSAYDREREAAEQCEKDKGACSERCQTLEAQAQTLEARIQTLQTQAEALSGQLKAAQTDTKAEPEMDPAVVREKVAQIARRTAADTTPADDDLKAIKGIGPKLEALLKELGITSYRQIAHLQEDDIQYVAAALGSFPDRITRDNWMAGARKAHEQKYGTAL